MRRGHIIHGEGCFVVVIEQMPQGVPVATFAVGEAGAANAGLFACALLALHSPPLREALKKFREDQRQSVLQSALPD